MIKKKHYVLSHSLDCEFHLLAGQFFTLFYTTTVFVMQGVFLYFMNSSFPCFSGPFKSDSTNIPWNTVTTYLGSSSVSIVYSICTSPLLYAAGLLWVMLHWLLKSNLSEVLQLTLEREREQSKKEIEMRDSRLLKLERQLEVHKKANKI